LCNPVLRNTFFDQAEYAGLDQSRVRCRNYVWATVKICFQSRLFENQ